MNPARISNWWLITSASAGVSFKVAIVYLDALMICFLVDFFLSEGSLLLADGSLLLADGSLLVADGSLLLADGSLLLADGSAYRLMLLVESGG